LGHGPVTSGPTPAKDIAEQTRHVASVPEADIGLKMNEAATEATLLLRM
jgi:hypothetical protein